MKMTASLLALACAATLPLASVAHAATPESATTVSAAQSQTILEVSASGKLSEIGAAVLGPDVRLTVRLHGPIAFDVDTANFASLEIYGDDAAATLTVSEPTAYDRLTAVSFPKVAPVTAPTTFTSATATSTGVATLAEGDTTTESTTPQNRVISVNFGPSGNDGTYKVSSQSDGLYGYIGMAPVAWTDFLGATDDEVSGSSDTISAHPFDPNSGITVVNDIQLSYNAKNMWKVGTATNFNVVHRGYLDDGSGVTIDVGNIPFTTYDVYVYSMTDNTSRQFKPIKIRHPATYGGEDGTSVMYTAGLNNGVAIVTTNDTDYFGTSKAQGIVLNDNVICIAGQEGANLTIETFSSDGSATVRSCVAAVQIVESFVKPITVEEGAVSLDSLGLSGTATLEGGAVLTVDVQPNRLKVIGPVSGMATLQIAVDNLDWSKIDLSEADNVTIELVNGCTTIPSGQWALGDVKISTPVTLTVDSVVTAPYWSIGGTLTIAEGGSVTVSAESGVTLPNAYKVIGAGTISAESRTKIVTTVEGKTITYTDNDCWLTGANSLRTTISDTVNWSDRKVDTTSWYDVDNQQLTSGPDISEASNVILTLESGATLVINEALTLNTLNVKGEGNIEVADGFSLTITSGMRVVDHSVKFSVTGTGALSLGTAIVSEGTTLTVPSSLAYTSVDNKGAVRFTTAATTIPTASGVWLYNNLASGNGTLNDGVTLRTETGDVMNLTANPLKASGLLDFQGGVTKFVTMWCGPSGMNLGPGAICYSDLDNVSGSNGFLITWQSHRSAVPINVSGGKLLLPRTQICFWESGQTGSLNITDGGFVQAKTIRVNNAGNNSALTIQSGELQIGEGGIGNNIDTFTMGGSATAPARLTAYGDATVSSPIVLNADSSFGAAADKTLTIASAVSAQTPVALTVGGTMGTVAGFTASSGPSDNTGVTVTQAEATGMVVFNTAMPANIVMTVTNAVLGGSTIAGDVTFGANARVRIPTDGTALNLTGTVTQKPETTITVVGTPPTAGATKVLTTTNDSLSIVSGIEGYRIVYSAGSYYILSNAVLKATVDGDTDTVTWTDQDGSEVTDPILAGANVEVTFTGTDAVLTMSEISNLGSLVIASGTGTISGEFTTAATSVHTGAEVTFDVTADNSLGELLVNSGATAVVKQDTIYTNLSNQGTVKVDVLTKALTVESGVFIVTGKSTRDNTGGNTVVEANAKLEINDSASIYTTDTHVSTPRVTVRGTLVTGEWKYGYALGDLGNNASYVTIDGGTVKFTNDTVGSTTGARGFTVGANGATLVMPEGGVFTRPNDEYAYIDQSASAGMLTLKGGTYILTQSATNRPLNGEVVVSEGATLEGSTKIATLAFDAGTMLCTTNSTQILTATTLEMPAGGTVTVKVAKDADAGAAVLNVTGANAENAKKFTTDVANTYVVASGTGFVLGRMTTADTDGNSPASGSKLANILAEAQDVAVSAGATSVNLAYGQCGGKTLTAEKAEAGAELFNNVVTTTTEGTTTTVTVAYEFGISKMAIRDIDETRYVIVGAKVQGAEGADFAETTAVQVLVNGTVAANVTEVTDETGTTGGQSSEAGVKWFRLPYADVVGTDTGTFSLTVKALPQTTTL